LITREKKMKGPIPMGGGVIGCCLARGVISLTRITPASARNWTKEVDFDERGAGRKKSPARERIQKTARR